MSNRENGWAVRADHRGTQQRSGILERNDDGLLTRARLDPPEDLLYRRLVVEDGAGRKAWTNPL